MSYNTDGRQQQYQTQPYQQPAPQQHAPQPGYTQQGYSQQQPAPYGQRPRQPQPFNYRGPGSKSDMKTVGANEWKTDLCKACCNEPFMCVAGYLLPWCCVCMQRKKLLMDDMSNYECCAGIWGRSCTDNCNKCTKGNETMCLCLESVCCLGCAIHGNRWIVMQQYGLKNDCCDVVIMWASCICSVLACLMQDENLENIADMIYYIVIGCMLAQHEHQMKSFGYPLGQLAVAPMR
jgi:hypothetical protein